LDAIVRKFIEIMGDEVLSPIEAIFKNAETKDLRQLLHDMMVDRMEMADRLYPFISIVLTEILFHEDLKSILYDTFIRRAIDSFSAFHAVMVSRGLMRGDVPPEAVFRTIFANMMVFIAQHKLFPQENDRAAMEREFETIFDVILNGVASARV
jgi:hypothetical protein